VKIRGRVLTRMENQRDRYGKSDRLNPEWADLGDASKGQHGRGRVFVITATYE